MDSDRGGDSGDREGPAGTAAARGESGDADRGEAGSAAASRDAGESTGLDDLPPVDLDSVRDRAS